MGLGIVYDSLCSLPTPTQRLSPPPKVSPNHDCNIEVKIQFRIPYLSNQVSSHTLAGPNGSTSPSSLPTETTSAAPEPSWSLSHPVPPPVMGLDNETLTQSSITSRSGLPNWSGFNVACQALDLGSSTEEARPGSLCMCVHGSSFRNATAAPTSQPR